MRCEQPNGHLFSDAQHLRGMTPDQTDIDDREVSARFRLHDECAEDHLHDEPAAGSKFMQSRPLIAAIARELWKIHGGNEVLNWLEAEILLENALDCQPSNPIDNCESRP